MDRSTWAEAQKKLKKMTQANPLRRVFLDCHGWRRDPVATVGDWLWCDSCEDHGRVQKVVE